MNMKRFLKRFAFVFLSALFLFMAASCEGSVSTSDGEKPLESSGHKLVIGGLSEYVILLSDEAQENEALAATELQQILQSATGALLSVVYEGEYGITDDTPLISIGNTALAQSAQVRSGNEELGRSGYIIKTVGAQLFIMADGNALGCVYAVYDFLEDAVGYRYYYTDEIYYEHKTDVELYRYDDVVKPTFDSRATYYPSLTGNEEYRRRLRYFLFDEEYGWKAHQQTSHVVSYEAHKDEHAYGATKVDPQTGETVPDHWFAPGGQQLCWTAGAEMEEQAAKDIYANIVANPDKLYFQIGQADNMLYCNCDRCQKAMQEWGMNVAGLQINWANHVVELVDEWVRRDYPEGRDVRIVIFAYIGTDVPPVVMGDDGKWVPFSEEVTPHEKLYFEYAPIHTNYSLPLEDEENAETYENLVKWSDILEKGKMSIWTYETNFSNYMYIFNNFNTFKEHLQTYASFGIDNVFSQGSSLSNQPTFQELRLFVESQIMWDVNKNYGELVDEFMQAFYKDAAPEMKEYYDLVRMRYEQMEALHNMDFSSVYADIGARSIWTENVVDAISRIFERAYEKIGHYRIEDPALFTKLQSRIKELEVSLIYTKLSYYRSNYSQTEINSMIDDFNYYTSLWSITLIKENDPTVVSGMFDSFRR